VQVLVVVTDACRLGLVGQALEKAGFEVKVVRGWSRAFELVQRTQPASVLVCSAPDAGPIRILRSMTRAPILVLLAEGEESDMIDLLLAGADDCQPASIDARELVVRVRSLLRRADWRQHPAAPLPRGVVAPRGPASGASAPASSAHK
jgi:DNA-binding response OmpR family regulator